MVKEEPKNGLRVAKIKNGTVIDRITPPTNLFDVLRILKIRNETHPVSIVTNVYSEKLEQGKSIVKIEGRELTKRETGLITLLAPRATINIIRDFKVVKKYIVPLPAMNSTIGGVIGCPNPNCISNDKVDARNVVHKFTVSGHSPMEVRCVYCDTPLTGDEIAKNIKY